MRRFRRLWPIVACVLFVPAWLAVSSVFAADTEIKVSSSGPLTVVDTTAGKDVVFNQGVHHLTEEEAKDLAEELYTPPTPPVKDTDGDGVPDPVAGDECPDKPGPASNNGCPIPPPVDTDGDGVPDKDDECDSQPGPAPNGGCPIPEPPVDPDGDNVPNDGTDKCPEVKGSQPDGCNPTVPPPTGDCTTTVTSTSAIQSAVNAAPSGGVVCLAAGSYGNFSVSASKPVTVTATQPGAVSVGRITAGGKGGLTVSRFIATGVTVSPSSSGVTIDSNRITTGGHAIGAYGDSGRISNLTISNNELIGRGKEVTSENDMIRLQYFDNVLVEHNKLRNIYQTNGGGHSDMLQTVHGGTNLTFRRNWITDQGGTQGFFIKDGAVNGLTLADNLIENDPSGNGYPISIYEVSNGSVTRNTVRNDSGNVAARGSGNRNIVVSQNVFQRAWQCESGSQCTVSGGSPAGISWNPSTQVYGP